MSRSQEHGNYGSIVVKATVDIVILLCLCFTLDFAQFSLHLILG